MKNAGSKRTPHALIILDGWGYREQPEFNAIEQADTPVWDPPPSLDAPGLQERVDMVLPAVEPELRRAAPLAVPDDV